MAYANGYIERREVLENGSLPAGERDAGKPRRVMYFAQVDHNGWYGPLRGTEEEAVADGRAYCQKVGLYVPCFGM
jgi:hypothetical protein